MKQNQHAKRASISVSSASTNARLGGETEINEETKRTLSRTSSNALNFPKNYLNRHLKVQILRQVSVTPYQPRTLFQTHSFIRVLSQWTHHLPEILAFPTTCRPRAILRYRRRIMSCIRRSTQCSLRTRSTSRPNDKSSSMTFRPEETRPSPPLAPTNHPRTLQVCRHSLRTAGFSKTTLRVPRNPTLKSQ